jgi:(1->4)-alpha-D-glucan 1-alpha-D-glucosylmutase
MLPGVPDFYQGTEFWDLSLVDPDNRRPVDFETRVRMLTANNDDVDAAAEGWPSGNTKFALTRRLLALRQRWPSIFSNGNYEPIETSGQHGDHVIAFARVLDDTAIITAVGRHFAPLTEGGRHWPERGCMDATLDLGRYRVSHDVLRDIEMAPDNSVPVSGIFGDIPVAVLRAHVR